MTACYADGNDKYHWVVPNGCPVTEGARDELYSSLDDDLEMLGPYTRISRIGVNLAAAYGKLATLKLLMCQRMPMG